MVHTFVSEVPGKEKIYNSATSYFDSLAITWPDRQLQWSVDNPYSYQKSRIPGTGT